MQRITPHLWFDKEAEEAARFYTSIFSNSKITNIATIQVWPTAMGEMMTKGTPEQIARVTEAFLQMKKFDIANLTRAYQGE